MLSSEGREFPPQYVPQCILYSCCESCPRPKYHRILVSLVRFSQLTAAPLLPKQGAVRSRGQGAKEQGAGKQAEGQMDPKLFKKHSPKIMFSQ